MTEKKYVRVFRAHVRDKKEGCLNMIELSLPADRCVKTVKDRLLEQPGNKMYSCTMCKRVHSLKEAEFAYQKSTFFDADDLESACLAVPEKCGENEFTVVATNAAGRLSQ